MNILILGTSNSLRRNGWVKGLNEKLEGAEVTNLSIGASPGVQFASVMDMDFSKFDYVFFDSVPNDEEYFLKTLGYKNFKYYNQIYYELFSSIANQSKLIVMGIPLCSTFKNSSIIYKTRRLLAEKVGAQFICFKSIISNIHSFLNSPFENLYDMDPHPTEFVAYLIGKAIAEVLNDDFVSKELEFLHDRPDYSDGFVTMDLPESYSDDKKYVIQNSLFKETFAFLNEKEIITLEEDLSCVGFYINKKNTQAHVNLIADNKVLSEISLVRDVDLKSFLKIFVPSPIANKINKITFNSEASEASCVPLTYHPLVKEKVVDEPIISISKMCFWRSSNVKWEDISRPFFQSFEITNKVNFKVNGFFWEHRKFDFTGQMIFSLHGYAFMFDKELQQCVTIDKGLIPFYQNELLPVYIKINDNESASFCVDLDGIRVTLSCFSYGIAVPDAHCLSNKSRKKLGVNLGVEFELMKYGDNYSFLLGDTYLRCYKMNIDCGLKFNAKKASLWERFIIQ